eukprot:7862728-Pyramimonas_sp.AAC.1
MSYLAPATRGASLALHGEPAVREAMAPALQWSKMIWHAVAFSDLSDLSWDQTRGPISRIPLCLAR